MRSAFVFARHGAATAALSLRQKKAIQTWQELPHAFLFGHLLTSQTIRTSFQSLEGAWATEKAGAVGT